MEFHTTPTNPSEPQILFVAGGYGSGKSKATLTEFVLRALENPRGTGAILAPTLPQLKKTSLKTLIEEVLPPPLIESYNKADMEIVLTNGYTIYVLPTDDETKLRSLNLGQFHLEEASGVKKSVYYQLLTRLRDPFTKTKAAFVCTNPDAGWVRDVFIVNADRKNPLHPEHADYNPFIKTFIWRTELNKHLPPNFIELISAGKAEWWKERFINGSFTHMDGAVYPTAPASIIAPVDIPDSWERVIGADFGLRNGTAVLFGAIDPKKGIVYIYDEHYVEGKTVPDNATLLNPKLATIKPGTLRFMVGDPSARNRSPLNGKSIFSLYGEYGIYFKEGNNQMEAGLLKTNSYLERGRLKIFNTCVNTAKQMINYRFQQLDIDEERNLDEKPVKYDDHCPDALRYLMMELPDDPDNLHNKSYQPTTDMFEQMRIAQQLDDDWSSFLSKNKKDSTQNYMSVGY